MTRIARCGTSEQIERGAALTREALGPDGQTSATPPGPYAIQAAIALQHARAKTAEATDWRRIRMLYDLLARIQPSPVVDLNRAVAIAMVDGPGAGLEAIDAIDGLDGYVHFHSARADMLARLGYAADAADAYSRALGLATGEVERAFLERKLVETSSQ